MNAQEPATPPSAELSAEASRNARIGLWLFLIYFLLYAGFIILSAFFPRRMASEALGGINLAILYGMTLIIGAFVLAIIYMLLVRRPRSGANH